MVVFSMRKPSTLQRALVRFWVPLLLVVSFCFANSAIATTEVSGNEVKTDGKLVNEELPKTNPEVHDEEAKFKGFFKKPIPIVKPIPKPIPIVKPIPVPVYKPIPKPIPVVKPIPVIKPIPVPVYKPIPKPIPVVKPIPIPVYKPIPKPFPVYKPIPKPFPVEKPIPKKPFFPTQMPTVEPESFLKPKPFFKKPIPKIPLLPKFKKPLPPPLPIHKPIPTP